MDESNSLMWLKRKQMLMKSSQVQLQAAVSMRTMVPVVGDSWEEQAFAEDAAGPLGGCIWPPRSYSCSFCRREFRSAQALGGHMNVHRRDRARLKQQSPSLSCEKPSSLLVASSSAAAAPQENYTSVGEYTFLSPFSHPNRRNDFLENHQGLSPYSSTELGFESTDEMGNYYSKKEEEESARLCIGNNKKGFVDRNLGLNLHAVAVNNNNSSRHHQVQGYYDEVIRCKRQKTHVYLMKPCLLQSDDYCKGFMRRNSMDELDLELRLGDPAATKVL